MLTGASLLALSSVALAKDTMPFHPLFAVQPGLRPNVHKATALPTWKFTWTYDSKNYTATFVGANPASPASTTVPVEIIPVEVTYKKVKEDPTKGHDKSVVARTIASPIFDSTTDYNQGGTDVGSTQYEDAFQRAALWGIGGSSSSYHVLLGTPTVLKKIKVAASSQGTELGVSVLLLPLAPFDNAIQSIVKAQPVDSLPIFLMTQTYMTSGGCCIGGYHSYTGTQAYSVSTYIKNKGKTVTFSQDDAALSHEVGEWMDDPETNNAVACGIYEVGDPLEGGQSGHPYGTWPYTVNGFTYHMQDLVLPPYFGAPLSTSINNGWFTFQGYTGLKVCSNGG
jgi:hypothetical protein